MGHIGKVNFILLFGIILFIPMMINYYGIKVLIKLLPFSFISWEYSLNELLFVTIICVLLGLLFGMFVQSKRMVVTSLEQDSNGIPFVKITFQDKGLFKDTDRIEIVWDNGQESIQTLHKRLKLKIPYDGESLNVIKGTRRVNFIDKEGNILYKI